MISQRLTDGIQLFLKDLHRPGEYPPMGPVKATTETLARVPEVILEPRLQGDTSGQERQNILGRSTGPVCCPHAAGRPLTDQSAKKEAGGAP